VKEELVSIVRRVGHSSRVTSAVSRVNLPFVQGRTGMNLIMHEHYSFQTGVRFDSDEAAARHYFDEGWRKGLVPNPFIDAPEARFSLARSQLLRTRLAALSIDARAPFPYRTSRWAGRAEGVLELTRLARRRPNLPVVKLGGSVVNWRTYAERARRVGDAARRAIADNLIDTDFYALQVGGNTPISAEAALDDLIANGELDGRMPNPFFEPEWYSIEDRGLPRRGRPISYFLDFIATGEVGPASPHFWGLRYAETLESPPRSLLGHFLTRAPFDQDAPSCSGIPAARRGAAERAVRRRVEEYVEHQKLLVVDGALARQHPRKHRQSDSDGTAIVFVDQRTLRSGRAFERLVRVTEQTLPALRIVIVAHEEAPLPSEWDLIADQHPNIDLLPRTESAGTFGAVIRDTLTAANPDGWALWTPDQSWEPDHLASAVHALRQDRELRAAAAVSPETPQPWLRASDVRWCDLDDGAGVVFAGSGPAAVLPDEHLDLGVAVQKQIEIAASGESCAVLEDPLVHIDRSQSDGPYERRAAANAARAKMLAPFEKDAEPGQVVVIPTFQDWEMTIRATRAVLRTTSETTRVHIIDNGSRRPVAAILATAFAGEPRVHLRRVPRNVDFALGSNIGASDGARDVVVFLNNDTEPQEGWLEPLLDALGDPANVAAQPLLLYGDRTVQTAGTVFFGGQVMPQHLLATVHEVDVDPTLADHEFSALTAACMAVRYRDLSEMRGFDAHYVNGMEDVDLCLRLRRKGILRVRPTARVLHYESRTAGRTTNQFANRSRFARVWGPTLDELDDRSVLGEGETRIGNVTFSRPPGSPLLQARAVYEHTAPIATISEAAPRLRWAIKTSATGDHWGDAWGDTYFAHSLAGALRGLGQEVVVDRSTSHYRESSAWDDVTLTLRGLTPFLPQPDAVNLLWIISHPELVTAHEVRSGYDTVYAAGGVWAERMSRQWGLPIVTLLQATDATRFHPDVTPAEGNGVLFVGRTRGIARPIVLDAVAAGADLQVHGDDGWENFIDPKFVKSSGLPNEQVPAAYAGADIVLNDHWREMADNGFLSNRLFDAAATGARIVSDHVPGMEAVFGDQVRTYSDVGGLRKLLDPSEGAWPVEADLRASARRVVEKHSFDARARVLLDQALAVRSERKRNA